ncbi:hypothetical protein KFE98_01225 [bacterium SCSIO 12741]|nr:hypothetical protein KFE98_01225 [bacterium SCSIO 12741]
MKPLQASFNHPTKSTLRNHCLQTNLLSSQPIVQKSFLTLVLTLALSLSSTAQHAHIITNKEYREFTEYVRDSTIRATLCEQIDGRYCTRSKDNSVERVDWDFKLDFNDPAVREGTSLLLFPEYQQINRKREWDTRKWYYDRIGIYPHEYIWCEDSSINRSWASFLTSYYFTHEYFDDYPVRGLNQWQIQAYLHWKHPGEKKYFTVHTDYNLELELPKKHLEVTRGEYNAFFFHTWDSIARWELGESFSEEQFFKHFNWFEENLDPPLLKTKANIDWKNPRILEVLQKANLITEEGLIDCRKMFYRNFQWDYYRGIEYGWDKIRDVSIILNEVNMVDSTLLAAQLSYLPDLNTKDKKLLDLTELDPMQLNAFYHWKKLKPSGKDVFEAFIPYIRYEPGESPEEQLVNNDIERLIRKGLSEEFFHFKTTFQVIEVY